MRGPGHWGGGVLAAAAVIALSGSALAGSVTTWNGVDADDLANAILGSGATLVGSASYTGTSGASGFFSGFGGVIGIDSGLLLTSGTASGAVGPNNSDGYTGNNGLVGDTDLNGLIPGFTTYDATVLEFDFTVASGDLYFNYVFASEEYNEWVGSDYNDVFAFFLDGVNIALIPSTTTPVSINNVNNGSYSAYYIDNDPSTISSLLDIQYDGFTKPLQAKKINVGAGTHHIKLAIADAGDRILDSGVFIQGGTFSDTPHPTVPLPASAWMGLSTLGLLGALRLVRRKS